MGTEPLYRYGLIAIAALLPTYLVRFSVLGIPTNVLEVLIIGVTIAGFLQPTMRRSWKEVMWVLPWPVATCLLLFVAAAVVSTIISPHPETSLGVLKGWILVPLLYAAQVYIATWRFPKIRDYILNALITSGVVVALIGISQIGTLDRIRSVYDVPASLALFLAPLIVLAVFTRIKIGGWQINYLMAGTMFIALLGTKSLAGILTVIVVLFLGTISLRPHIQLTRKPLVLISVSILLVIAVWVSVQKTSYLLQPASSAYVRLQLWDISGELIRENPILGIGLGTFEPAYQGKLHERFESFKNSRSQKKPLSEFVYRDPHSLVLSFWLNTGLVGVGAFLVLHVWIFYQRGLKFSVALALFVLILFGFTDTIFWKNDLAILHFVLIALTLGSLRQYKVLLPAQQIEG
ncbi:MAG: O-antigen ligase family protein [Candidatus Andersenbacteria bacterium]|nr:O-antigen ligase family protein [Candidatus Andersenbacteria bacterium]MBI3250752.1 O-antigen ligase family protein [Candidatus Andersenbacteria bacterium]